MILHAGQTIEQAKTYIAKHSLTREQVKISTNDDGVYVVNRVWGKQPW